MDMRSDDMAVIDLHEHVRTKSRFPGDRGEALVTTAEELVAIMDENGIDRMAVLPLTSPETFPFIQSVEEVYEALDRYPGRFIKFCNVDPRLEYNWLDYDFTPLLEYYRSLGAVALGEFTANLWWDDPRVQNLLRGCEKVGFPVTFHIATREFNTYGLITEPGLGGLERALQRFPNLILLGHSQGFWSEVGPNPGAERDGYPKGKVLPGGRVPELMRRYPNLWGDLSAGSGYNAISRDPEWGYDFIEEFQDRLVLGLDLCLARNIRIMRQIPFLEEAVQKGKISRAAFEKVVGGNAIRLLKLDGAGRDPAQP